MTGMLLFHRALVIVGVVAALSLGGVSIKLAADWTRAAAPLAVPPVSLAELQAGLATEQARADALQHDLDAIESAAGDLSAALAAAQERVGTDTATADQLRADMAAAQARLAKLQAALAKAAAAARAGASTSSGSTSTSTPRPAPTPEPHDDD